MSGRPGRKAMPLPDERFDDRQWQLSHMSTVSRAREIQALADEHNVSRSEMIAYIIADWFDAKRSPLVRH